MRHTAYRRYKLSTFNMSVAIIQSGQQRGQLYWVGYLFIQCLFVHKQLGQNKKPGVVYREVSQHQVETILKDIDQLRDENRQIRADYTFLKDDYIVVVKRLDRLETGQKPFSKVRLIPNEGCPLPYTVSPVMGETTPSSPTTVFDPLPPQPVDRDSGSLILRTIIKVREKLREDVQSDRNPFAVK